MNPDRFNDRTTRDFTPEERARWERAVAEETANRETNGAQTSRWLAEKEIFLSELRQEFCRYKDGREQEYEKQPSHALLQEIFLLRQLQEHLSREPSVGQILSCARMMGKKLSLTLSDE